MFRSVTNTGKTAGQEIVQIYVQDPRTLPFVPYWKRMLGFARTPTLAPGAKATLTIPLLWVDVAMFDDTMTLRLWPGSYIVSAGGASNDTPVQTTVTL
jgi:beta-glucosidase